LNCHGLKHSPPGEKENSDNEQHRQEDRQGIIEDVVDEAWSLDLCPFCDCLDHEVRAVADVRHRAEKHRAQADRNKVLMLIADKRVWIVKLLDIPAGHKDSKQSGRVEFAYSLMARAAGIDISETRLFSVERDHGNRGLFAVRRFDRQGEERIHMQSLAGFLHRDFSADAVSYEDFARVALELTGDHRTLAEIYRRLAFNVATSNSDDHAKNFAFLCNRAGQLGILANTLHKALRDGRLRAGVKKKI